MEFVEGESPKGPLPFEDAWKIALQIADALEYAHERGVIHRDLKPANVKVTPDGVVKLLDFGLAKAFSQTPDLAASDPENSPTLTLGATVAGTVMGTAAYMSPEQAKGKRVDKRADIWSWGVVLYELLTGERLFKGEDSADTLAQVLAKEPDLERAPAKVRRLLGECLQKDPKQRLRDIGDATRLLGEETVSARVPRRNRVLAWAAIAAVGIVAAVGWRHQQQPEPKQNFVLTIVPPKGSELLPASSLGGAPLVSPDGRYVLGGVLLRDISSLEMQALRGIAGIDGEPFWSPDSKWLAFHVPSGEIRKVRVPDGTPETLGRLPGFYRGGAWAYDGTILATSIGGDFGLYVLPPGGRNFEHVAVTELKAGSYFYPEFLPGRSDFLFALRPKGSSGCEIYVATLEGSRRARW